MLQGIATITEKKKLKNGNKHQPTKSKLSGRKSPFWCQSLLVLTQGTAFASQRVWVWDPGLPINWWANNMASASLVLTLRSLPSISQGTLSVCRGRPRGLALMFSVITKLGCWQLLIWPNVCVLRSTFSIKAQIRQRTAESRWHVA